MTKENSCSRHTLKSVAFLVLFPHPPTPFYSHYLSISDGLPSPQQTSLTTWQVHCPLRGSLHRPLPGATLCPETSELLCPVLYRTPFRHVLSSCCAYVLLLLCAYLYLLTHT